MADGIELASAYVTIIPSLKGATKSIEQQLGGVDVSRAGQRMGKSLAGAMAKGMDSASLKSYEQAVARVERTVSQAMRNSEDATKRVEIAQKRLAEARAQYGDDSSQASQAELELTKAQRTAESASQKYMSAIEKLGDAQQALATATSEAEAAAKRQASALGRVQAAAAKAGSSLQTGGAALNSMGERAMNLGGMLTAGVTAPMAAAVAAVGGFALSTASAAETTEISFTTMLGSAEAAERMMGELSDFAARTPFELSGLQTATRQLLAYGFTAEDVIPMLTAVGDATAALGTGQAGIESVTRALGQMQTRGKVSAEEMLQLTEAGIPAWEYLARAIGTDTAGAMDAVSKGAVDANTGIQALTKGMEEDFGGMMESQSKTVAGLMSNLSDAIQQPLMELRNTDAYEHFAAALSDVVDEAGPLVESVMPLMEDGLDSVAGLLDSGADAMKNFASMSKDQKKQLLGIAAAAGGAGPALTVFGGALRAIGTVGGAAGTVISKAAEGLGKLQSKARPAASAAEAAAKSTETLGTAAAGASTSTGLLTKGLGMLGTVAKGAGVVALVAAVTALAAKLYESYQHAELVSDATRDFDAVMGQAGESISDVNLDVEGLLQDMSALADSAADTMAEFGANSAMLDQYTATIERLAGQSGLTAQEQYELQTAVEGYNDITGDTVEVIDAANGKLSESTDYINANADAWRQNAEAQALQSIATDYLEQQYRAAQDLKVAQEQLAEAQQKVADTAGDPLANTAAVKAFDEARQNVEDLSAAYETASRNAEDFGNTAAVAASSLDSTIKTALEGLPASMQGVGLDIATSLSQGISSGSLSVDEATRFITQGVGGTIAAMSPEMQTKGLQVATALADGISSGNLTVGQAMQVLKAAATGQVSTLPTELQGYGATAAQMMGSAMTANAGSVSSGALALDSAAKSGVSGTPGSLGATGTEAGQSMASGMSGQSGSVNSAGASLASSARTGAGPAAGWLSATGRQSGSNFASGVGSARGATSSAGSSLASAAQSATNNNGNAYGWGNELGSNFAAGISAMAGAVADGASKLAAAASSFLHFSEPEVGPLVGINDSGYELGANYASAMERSVPLVARAAERLAGAASFEASPEWSSGMAPYGKYRAAHQGNQQSNTYNITIDGASLNASPQLMDAFEAFMGALSRTYGMGVV